MKRSFIFGLVGVALVQSRAYQRLAQSEGGAVAGELGEWNAAVIEAIDNAQSAILAAGTTLALLIAQAKTKTPNPSGDNVIPIPAKVIPSVAAHIASSQVSQPSYLHRVGVLQAARNRLDALRGIPPAGLAGAAAAVALGWQSQGVRGAVVTAGSILAQLDEYPFASSAEGGYGSTVAAVPARENAIQGGIIGACYVLENISVTEGYYVVVLP